MKKCVRPKRIIIIGATSGIGRALAIKYIEENPDNIIGIAGRRSEALEEMVRQYPGRVFAKTLDVQTEESIGIMQELLSQMGGADIIIYSAGVGTQSKGPEIDHDAEMSTIYTNVEGFMRIIMFSYNYFRSSGGGQFVTIGSVAGIRPLRHSPAYSASKRYEMHYTSCLAQLAHKYRESITFTTIIPGFIQTELLKNKYPMVVSLEKGTRLIYKAISKQKRRAIVPGRWRLIVFVWKLIPFWEKF